MRYGADVFTAPSPARPHQDGTDSNATQFMSGGDMGKHETAPGQEFDLGATGTTKSPDKQGRDAAGGSVTGSKGGPPNFGNDKPGR